MELDLDGEDGEKLGKVLATFTVSPKNVEDRQEVNACVRAQNNCLLD